MHNCGRALGLVGLTLVFAFSAYSFAASSLERTTRDALYLDAPRKGAHRIFRREPGPGKQQRVNQIETLLRSRLALGPTLRRIDNPEHIRAEGEDWMLRVADDGNHFVFQKERSAAAPRIANGARPSKTAIFSQGTKAITALLGDVVKLGSGEKLVEMGIKYEKNAGQATGGPIDPTVVSGWIAVFGRSIDGNLVVGGGSQVTISFDAAGSVEGLSVDWPQYADTGSTAITASLEEVRKRGGRQESPLAKNEARMERRLECGYLDLGGRHNGLRIQKLQPGCLRFVDSQDASLSPGDSFRAGQIQVIQSAMEPIPEPALEQP